MSSICNRCGQRIEFRYINGQATPIHVNGGCSGSRDSSTKRYDHKQTDLKRRKKRAETIIRSFTIPETSCPVCGDLVYYYENEYGSKVFFDELGPPWPKHPCTDNTTTAESNNLNSPKNSSEQSWLKYYLGSVVSSKYGDRFIITWRGKHITPDYKIKEQFVLKSLSKIDYSKYVLKKMFYYKSNGDRSYELFFFIDDGQLKNIKVKGYSAEKFQSEFFSKTKEPVRKKKEKKNKSKKDILANDFVGLRPLEDYVSCPFCGNTFERRKQLIDHLDEHWKNFGEKSMFEYIDKETWLDMILAADEN